MHNSFYYLINGGPVMDARNAFIEDRRAAFETAKELARDVGAEGWCSSGTSITGWRFPEGQEPPKNWIKVKGVAGHYRPRATGNEKIILQRQQAIRVPNWPSFQERLGLGCMTFIELPHIYYASTEKIGDSIVLRIPRLSGEKTSKAFTPPEGLQPLKDSEYYALKEAAEAEPTQP